MPSLSTTSARKLLSASLIFLSTLNAVPSRAQPLEVDLQKDLPYKTGPTLTAEERTRCQLDLYVPRGAKDLPCLVWFHGGGLTGGDKTTRLTAALCRSLAAEGYVVASANYRLNPQVKYPAYLEDAAAAVAWLYHNAAKHGGNPTKLFIGGHSAGGYLSALIGTDPRYLARHDIKPQDIAGLIPISGQMSTHFTVLAERGLPENTLITDEAAPLHYARKDTPPVLLIYGEKDMPLRAEENLYFAAALKAAGNSKVRCLQIPGRDHGGTIGQIPQPEDPVRREILAFLKSPD